MSTTYTSEISILLYHPEPLINSPEPVGEFRGRKLVYGDASGGFIIVQFVPTNLAQGQQFVWLWMNGCIIFDNASVPAYDNQEILRLNTGEYSDMTFQTGSDLRSGAVETRRSGGHYGELDLRRIRVPHRPDGSIATGNSFNCEISQNVNGAGYIASVWGYIFHPEVRTHAGGIRVPWSI